MLEVVVVSVSGVVVLASVVRTVVSVLVGHGDGEDDGTNVGENVEFWLRRSISATSHCKSFDGAHAPDSLKAGALRLIGAKACFALLQRPRHAYALLVYSGVVLAPCCSATEPPHAETITMPRHTTGRASFGFQTEVGEPYGPRTLCVVHR
jgi:hypothetical protein